MIFVGCARGSPRWANLWLYILAPLVGAVVAALLFLPSRWAAGLLARHRISGALFAFQGRGDVLAKAFAYSLALQTLVVLNGWLLAKALHVPIPLPYFFLIVPLAVQ